jgi:gliding motility-associated-like protein
MPYPHLFFMNKYLTLLFFLFGIKTSFAQTVAACTVAQAITQTANYCSSSQQYDNLNAYEYTWFKFTATATDVTIVVSGAGSGGTLTAPQINLFNDCSGTELVGSEQSADNVTSLYKGGLLIGTTYYIEVTGTNRSAGSFKLCLNNYNPIAKPGQDCETAAFLCSLQTISQQNITGAGKNNDEAKGTCLSIPGQVSESNSIWYKWQAANNGTLVYTITPANPLDDIDWVLFDLGITGDCANVTPANAIRCKAGYGVTNTDCPNDAIYYKTGLDFNETDLTEPPGCGHGQNGKVKYVTMQQGHVYGLLINNFSSGNSGFTLAFTDQEGKAGTGTFEGPKPVISAASEYDCTVNQQYTFKSNSTNYDSLKWSFGDGASISTAKTAGPFQIKYATPGIKTVSLEAYALGGCSVIATQQISVGLTPPVPTISADKNIYCVNDTVRLQASTVPNVTYQWQGPDGYQSDSSTAVVPVTGNGIAGVYKLVVSNFQCSSDPAYISLPEPQTSPTAAFHTDPSSVNALYGPVTIQFINDTFNADTFLWEFGDGSTSSLKNPVHSYHTKGNFNVKLTASNINSCYNSTLINNLVIIQDNNYIFIPNTFTPNGDGINDLFNVTITNLKTYHIQIFSRWGQLVFESKDLLNSWDGNYNGKQATWGVYYYVIEGEGSDNAIVKRSGSITLIR